LASANVVNRVKELRERHGWTQQELAEAVGVSRQSINSIERQRYMPSLQVALLFARLFHMATDDLFHLENGTSGYAERPRRDDFTD